MLEIKPYKPRLVIYYKDIDWEISALTCDLEHRTELMKIINSQKFVDIEWITIPCFKIQKIMPTDNSFDEIYYSCDRKTRNRLAPYIEGRKAQKKILEKWWLLEKIKYLSSKTKSNENIEWA